MHVHGAFVQYSYCNVNSTHGIKNAIDKYKDLILIYVRLTEFFSQQIAQINRLECIKKIVRKFVQQKFQEFRKSKRIQCDFLQNCEPATFFRYYDSNACK